MSMNNPLNIPWEKYGVIIELAERLNGISPQFGKTVLQKAVFLLQEIFGVKAGYDFKFYSYGPFTSDVSADLDFVSNNKGVNISQVVSETGGYLILPGEKASDFKQKARDFLGSPSVERALSDYVKEFGKFSARDLELYATAVYTERDFRRDGETPTKEELLQSVSELKPRFRQDEISRAIDYLREKGWIRLAA